MYNHTILVHTAAMRSANKTVRQSVSLPANVAAQVRSMAKTRRLSSNRMLVELIENGIEAEKSKQEKFSNLPGVSAMPLTLRKPSASAMNWAEWFLATDAQDRVLGQSAGGRPPAPHRPDARPGNQYRRPESTSPVDRIEAGGAGKVTGTRSSVHSRFAATARTPRRSCFAAKLLGASPFDRTAYRITI
jgi:hypothetical protein